MRLQTQTDVWTKGYWILGLVILAAGLFATIHKETDATPMADASDKKPQLAVTSITMEQRLFWIFLAFVPSSLMLGVTSHMANNIASAPFLWIIPLALYLLTFIIVFAKKPMVTSNGLGRLFPWVILVAVTAGLALKNFVLISIGLSLVCYFIITLLCHGRLAEMRPDARNLTEFYIWMSFGGVLGGVFNALIAPGIFSNVYEYLIVLLIAQMAVPFKTKTVPQEIKFKLSLAKYALAGLVVFLGLKLLGLGFVIPAIAGGSLFLFGLSHMRDQKKTLPFDIGVLATCVIGMSVLQTKPILMDRSFFGVLHVEETQSDFGVVHRFIHGDTVHNYQFRDPKLRKVPLAYYAAGNSFDLAMQAARKNNSALNVSMVGLGAGAMACYEQPGDNWTYYEIDPAVVKMALNPKYFSYMSDCANSPDIRIGDARIALEDTAPKSQDIIIVDAFSSDSIPTHLLTKEAMALYQSKLKDNGLVFFHTSNRVMDISSVAVRLADDAGLDSRYVAKLDFSEQAYREFYTPSLGVLVGNKDRLEVATQDESAWRVLIPSPSVKVWSDDYSSVLGPIKSHYIRDSKVQKP